MNKFLNTIPYSILDLWDVKRYSKVKFISKYQISLLGDHINSEIKKINLPKYPNKVFSILGISNDRGLYDAYDMRGEKFNQSYKIVKNGFIAYNPYRINVGSIGIKNESTKGDLISPAYVVISCKETLIPEFLFMLMKTKFFNEQVKENTSGSVRQNLTFDALSRIMVPVPPIEIQENIISEYNNEIIAANKVKSLTMKDLSDYYIDVLYAKNYEYNPLKKYFFGLTCFKKLNRWDSWTSDIGLLSDEYEIIPFEDLILKKPQYGANVKGTDIPCKYRYIRITDINENGTLNKDIKYPEKIDSTYILNNDDFLIARSGNTVGKTFLYKKEYGDAIYAGYLVRYVLNKELIVPEYLLYYTKTAIFKNWVLKNQRIAGQPNINGQEFLSFPVILPSIEKQQIIVEHANEILMKIKKDELEINNIIEKAKEKFINAIYGDN